MKVKINNKKIEVEYYRGFFRNLKGLMFSKRKNIMLSLPYESRHNAAIHSLFVFFPFYAIFLNSKKEIVDFKRIKPFTFYKPKKQAKYILEIYEDVRHLDKKITFRI